MYDHSGTFLHKKEIATNEEKQFVIRWLQQFYDKENTRIAYLRMIGTDMQHNQGVYITNNLSPNDIVKHLFTTITHKNLFVCVIYVTIRHCITQTWINDRDQFFYPTAEWQNDFTFQCNCLTYMLFHGQNRITSVEGTNHWIPFTEEEVDAKEKFESHFMTDFISGKLAKHQLPDQSTTSLRELGAEKSFVPTEPLVFSPEAIAVFDAGRELWRYYHAQPNANPNASYYDIREHFQGRSVPGRGNSATSDQNLRKGRMNSRSEDAEYNRLLGNLKAAMEALRLKIVPKVYEYGFLI